MPSEYSISQLINIGKLSQILSSVDNQNKLLLKSGNIDPRLPISIYQVWKPLSLRYAANPNDTALRQIGEWLLQLCGPYALQAQNIINGISSGLPILTGPSNQSGIVGFTATFSVTVTSSTRTSYQWFQNGVLIPGATGSSYIVNNAQLNQNGNTYFVMATNSAGPVVSNTAVLTVTASLQGALAYMSTDPGPTLVGGTDPFNYPVTFTITAGQPWVSNVPVAATPNMFIIVKGPSTESVKTTWNNGGVNTGNIPDLDWQNPLVIGSIRYYYTRQSISLDPTQTLTLT